MLHLAAAAFFFRLAFLWTLLSVPLCLLSTFCPPFVHLLSLLLALLLMADLESPGCGGHG